MEISDCTFTENSTLDGLKKALKHCTKYEDRMYLQFLIRKEMDAKEYCLQKNKTADREYYYFSDKLS